MISIKAVSNSATASAYFSEGDYYAKEENDNVASEWNGRGAEDLDVSGAVSKETFKQLLDGALPGGQQLGRTGKDGQKEHAKGWDLTFSAPKSVSIMALVAGDKRLIEAHQSAVKTALAYAEKHFVRTRVTEKGITNHENTGNATFASFLHKTSRALDPQLHTHNVLINATLSKDGKWRSIDSSAIYENSMAIASVYKMQLATLVRSLGYETEKGKHGNIEIKGVDKSLIDEFSKRRKEILKAKEEFGYSTAKGMDRAAVRTRSAKTEASPEKLNQQWSRAAGAHLGALKTIVRESVRVARTASASLVTTTLDKPLSKAIQNLSERNASFTHTQLVQEVHRWTDGAAGVQGIEKSIEKAVMKKNLYPGMVKGFTGYTTREQLKLEKSILRIVGSGINKAAPFLTKNEAELRIENSRLNAGQGSAFRLAVTTKDQFIGVQGFAGTGKTYLLSTLRDALESKEKTVLGFAPTNKAVAILEKESGIKSFTVARLIRDIETGKTSAYRKAGSFVVDEASMVGSKNMKSIVSFAKTNGIKVLFLGDKLQHEAVASGKPFEQLTLNGMKTAVMKDIMRQKDSPNLLAAVHSLIERSPSRAFKHISGQVHEVPNRAGRIEQIVQKVLGMDSDARTQHLLLIPDNATRSEVNNQVQEGLVQRRELSDNSASVTSLSNAGFTDVEKGTAKFYKIGQYVVFNSSSKALSVSKNDMFRVVGKKQDSIIMEGKSGRQMTWSPSKMGRLAESVEVYEPHEKKIHEGEVVKATRTDKEAGIRIGLEGNVTAIDQDTQRITIIDKNDKEHIISFNEAAHWDLNYATTVYTSQGATVKDVTLHLESNRINLTNLKTAYVGVTRSKGDIDIYVDNQKSVTDALAHRSGASTSAFESQRWSAKAEIDYGAMSFSQKVQHNLKEIFGLDQKERSDGGRVSDPQSSRLGNEKEDLEIER